MTDIDTLLDAVRAKTPSSSLGALEAFRALVFGSKAFFVSNAAETVLQVNLEKTPYYITPFFEKKDTFEHIQHTHSNLNTLCSDGLASWSETLHRDRAQKEFHEFGAGMHFVRSVSTEAFDVKAFVDIIERYNCHRKIGERIASDLIAFGQRTTTVQAHLVAQWEALENDLKNIGVTIDRAIPRLKPLTTTQTHLDDKISMLQKQFKR